VTCLHSLDDGRLFGLTEFEEQLARFKILGIVDEQLAVEEQEGVIYASKTNKPVTGGRRDEYAGELDHIHHVDQQDSAKRTQLTGRLAWHPP